MKTLSSILKEALREIPEVPEEQPPVSQPQTSAGNQEDLIELPSLNIVVTVIRPEKKFIFAPQQHTAVTTKLRTLVTMLKQRFDVVGIKNLEADSVDETDLRGTFEVELDPRENLDRVVEFIRTEGQR